MAPGDTLKEYRGKRDFQRTGEPRGTGGRKRRRGGKGRKPRFVIQRHDARSEHYDFRLEVGGVLKSWAVPKGPSTDPREKRLAVATEDHPLDYADFEGVIPEGEYGGGTVMVWDEGTYRSLREDEGGEGPATDLEAAIEEGKVSVWLEGEKLHGGYSLVRFRRRRGKAQWLLVKMEDDEADARRNPVSTQPKSVKTGRTLNQIASAEAEG